MDFFFFFHEINKSFSSRSASQILHNSWREAGKYERRKEKKLLEVNSEMGQTINMKEHVKIIIAEFHILKMLQEVLIMLIYDVKDIKTSKLSF